VLSKTEWGAFEETHGWREVVEIVKERMKMINQDLLNPEACNSNEKRVQFQAEYLTCLYFINLPKIDIPEEEVNETQKDRSVGPDLEPFRS
jgi:hypothetical protein